MRKLTTREAAQFASMVLSGAPAGEVVRYFWPANTSEDLLAASEDEWPMQPEVLEALQQQTGGMPWHQLSDDQRLDLSLKKHYNEMAYFLWTTNYAECGGSEKMKSDTCRQAIETKVAGMAGRESPLAQFYHDLLTRYDQQGKAVN